MKKSSIVFTLLLFTTASHGGIIQWNIAEWYYDKSPFQLDEYVLEIYNSIQFYSKVISSPEQADLNNFRWLRTSYGCALLLTDYDTLIDYDLFANADYFFYQTSLNDPFPGDSKEFPSLVIPKTEDDLSNSIILAFALCKGAGVGLEVDYYGWIELGYDGEEVYILNSAMIDGMWSGIYAGVIPEPSTALLAMSGCAILLLRRRKRKITP